MRSNVQSLSSLPRNALVPKLHSFFVPLPSRALSNPVVICVSRAFCSMDQEKRETARSPMSQSLSLNFSRASQDSEQSLFCSKICERLCYVSMRIRWPQQKRDCSLSDSRPRLGKGGGGYCHIRAT